MHVRCFPHSEVSNFAETEQLQMEQMIEGRNAVIEAFRSGKTVDKLYVQEGLGDLRIEVGS